MKEILLFAGTTEGRKLSECLAEARIVHTVCVATEYGEIVLKEHPMAKVYCGRMNREEMYAFLQEGNFGMVVDATHPYAGIVTENIRAAAEACELPCLRLKRELDVEECGRVTYFDSNEACAEALAQVEGNILLTTGSKELAVFGAISEVRERLYARVLPSRESLELCMNAGISGKQILALQGPFTTEMNEAMLRQYRIRCLVTKASGRVGGFQEKLEAAKRVDVPVYVIGLPKADEGDSFGVVCQKLEQFCGCEIKQTDKLEIVLAGIGMGAKENLTREVQKVIEEADILLGAERMTAPYHPRLEKKTFYRAAEILPYLEEVQKRGAVSETLKVVVLFSGDSGFYSGCQALYKALLETVEAGKLRASVRILPGISSVAYLAACIGESWQDAAIYSIHGRKLLNLEGKIAGNRKTFLLLSGAEDLRRLGKDLVAARLGNCRVFAGYQLSYPEQQVLSLTPEECCEQSLEGMYTCCILNPVVESTRLTHGRADAEFVRGRVPMTKEEVREISICKLKLHGDAVLYDIGSGTGSIAVEAAGLSDEIKVYAIEYREEALELIAGNREKFRLENMEIVAAKAPEGLENLPIPTHAFIGGSGGKLREILTVLYRKNPSMRVVINAVTLETVCEIKELLGHFAVSGEEMVQVQVSRNEKVGNYHMMRAENPVWVCAFDFLPEIGKGEI